jgi:hypothetical protein
MVGGRSRAFVFVPLFVIGTVISAALSFLTQASQYICWITRKRHATVAVQVVNKARHDMGLSDVAGAPLFDDLSPPPGRPRNCPSPSTWRCRAEGWRELFRPGLVTTEGQ